MRQALQELTAAVREVLHDTTIELAPEQRFDDLVGSDSMDIVSIVVEAECRFGVLFDPSEIEDLVTVGDLLRRIAQKRAMAAA